ncbi:hypothetical protein RHMOL_Rhmol02G0105700 [Rhododendron molle]|uniref:Uncharacterized protein n=1 Tax=Rhododendron molle TaxID=49168 RepID=A0ACC0PQ07_RHOML|nr:hypothetical protein RHMOL_Rhmol02G0105700 [Rhododendron molle]
MKKKKTIVSNGDNLPPEILADILSRLSVKSLCQFKCVSPSWNSLISSPYFAKTHLQRNPSPKIVLFCDSEDLYSVDFATANPAAKKLDFPSVQYSHKWVKVMGSCNGLLLVCDQGQSEFLLNPSTRECKKLPTCPLSTPHLFSVPYVYLHGFGYDSSRDDYKVVMLPYKCIKSDSKSYCDGDTNNTYVFVYSLKTDAWRRIQGFHYHPLVYFSEVHRLPSGVYFNERLHWLCRRTGGSDGSFVIVAFDSSGEIFREVQLPTLFSYSEILYHRMIVLGGYLCVIVLPSSFWTEVWMMKDYGETSVSDGSYVFVAFDLSDEIFKEVQLPTSLSNYEILYHHMVVLRGCLCVIVCPLSYRNEVWMIKEYWVSESWTKSTINPRMVLVNLLKIRGEVLELVYQDKLVVYNPKKKTLRDLVVPGILPKCQHGVTYVKSLVSPNHGGGIGRVALRVTIDFVLVVSRFVLSFDKVVFGI